MLKKQFTTTLCLLSFAVFIFMSTNAAAAVNDTKIKTPPVSAVQEEDESDEMDFLDKPDALNGLYKMPEDLMVSIPKGTQIQLKSGKAVVVSKDKKTTYNVSLLKNIAVGDLSNDKIDDEAAILVFADKTNKITATKFFFLGAVCSVESTLYPPSQLKFLGTSKDELAFSDNIKSFLIKDSTIVIEFKNIPEAAPSQRNPIRFEMTLDFISELRN